MLASLSLCLGTGDCSQGTRFCQMERGARPHSWLSSRRERLPRLLLRAFLQEQQTKLISMVALVQPRCPTLVGDKFLVCVDKRSSLVILSPVRRSPLRSTNQQATHSHTCCYRLFEQKGTRRPRRDRAHRRNRRLRRDEHASRVIANYAPPRCRRAGSCFSLRLRLGGRGGAGREGRGAWAQRKAAWRYSPCFHVNFIGQLNRIYPYERYN